MRVIGLTVLLGLALVSTASAAAQTDQSVSGPFSKLFAPSPPLKPDAPTQQTDANVQRARAMLFMARPGARIVCGMPMVPVDPAFDAKIRRPVPSGKTFTIKRIKPPICGQ